MANIALLPNSLVLTRFCSRDKRLTIKSREYLFAIFSKISPEDKADSTNYKQYRFAKAELRAQFGFSKSVFYSDLWNFCEEIASFVFNVSDQPKRNLKTENIKVENLIGDSYITISIHKDLLNVLTDIGENCKGYTAVNVDKYISFKNEYTKAFYVHLSDRLIEFDKPVEFTEDELREILGMQDNYEDFRNVLNYGLKIARKEMMDADAPDIFFNYETIKGVRNKITGVRVTKVDATKNVVINQLELEKSYNKHCVNQELTEESRSKYLGWLTGHIGFDKHNARFAIDRIPAKELYAFLHPLHRKIYKANIEAKVAGNAPKYASPVGYMATELKRHFNNPALLKSDSDFTAYMNEKKTLNKAA